MKHALLVSIDGPTNQQKQKKTVMTDGGRKHELNKNNMKDP